MIGKSFCKKKKKEELQKNYRRGIVSAENRNDNYSMDGSENIGLLLLQQTLI